MIHALVVVVVVVDDIPFLRVLRRRSAVDIYVGGRWVGVWWIRTKKAPMMMIIRRGSRSRAARRLRMNIADERSTLPP
jgi:hypothetical protein